MTEKKNPLRLARITLGYRVFMNSGQVRRVIFQSYGISCGIRLYCGAGIFTSTVGNADGIAAD
jgi:hypothetical protein